MFKKLNLGNWKITSFIKEKSTRGLDLARRLELVSLPTYYMDHLNS